MNSKRSSQPKRDFFGPILLIMIGLVFLANNLGLFPAEGWGTIFRLWPLLLIVAGLNDLLRGEGIIWPLLLVAAGSFFLMNNFGPRELVSWSNLLRLWPLLLIAAGIDLIIRERTVWTTILGLMLVAALVGGGYFLLASTAGTSPDAVQIYQELSQDIEEARITLSLGSGQLSVKENRQKEPVLAGTITPQDTREEALEVGDRLDYSLTYDQPSVYPSGNRWDLSLPDQLPIALTVENGAGEIFAALEAVELSSLEIDQGVGRLVARIPEQVAGSISLKQAIGEITVIVPQNRDLVLLVSKGLSVLDAPREFVERGETVSRDDPDDQQTPLTISLEQAIGKINIEYTR